MNTYYVDGKYVSADKAVIPVDDLAILRGLGVFDILRTYDGKPLFLKEHIQRLIHSAKEIELTIPWTPDQLIEIICKTVHKNPSGDLNIRIIITGGSSPDFTTPQGKPRLLVLVHETKRLPSIWYEKGVKVITLFSSRAIPGAKSINYLPATIAMNKAKKKGAVEAIYVNSQNNVLEGTTSNLFIFIKGKLVTPGGPILAGITREYIISLGQTLFDVEIRDIEIDEFMSAEEIFITGTNKGLVPVIQVNDTTIGKGIPGPLTEKMMSAIETEIPVYTRS